MRLNDEENVKFDGKNYHEWAASTKFTLMAKGLWQQVIEKPLEKKVNEQEDQYRDRILKLTGEVKVADNKALGIIGRTVKNEYMEQISKAETAYQAWDALKRIYEGDTVSNLMTVRTEFYALKMEENDDIVLFLGKLEKCKRFCENTTAPISEQELIIKVMYSLPHSMDSFCQSVRAIPDSMSSYEDLKSRLLTEYMLTRGDRVFQAKPQQAMQAQRDKKIKCYNCGKVGHIKAECYAHGGGKSTRQKLANKAEKKR